MPQISVEVAAPNNAGAIEVKRTTSSVKPMKTMPGWHGRVSPFLGKSLVKINRWWIGSRRRIMIIGAKGDDLVLLRH